MDLKVADVFPGDFVSPHLPKILKLRPEKLLAIGENLSRTAAKGQDTAEGVITVTRAESPSRFLCLYRVNGSDRKVKSQQTSGGGPPPSDPLDRTIRQDTNMKPGR